MPGPTDVAKKPAEQASGSTAIPVVHECQYYECTIEEGQSEGKCTHIDGAIDTEAPDLAIEHRAENGQDVYTLTELGLTPAMNLKLHEGPLRAGAIGLITNLTDRSNFGGIFRNDASFWKKNITSWI